jgi:glycosyltransferase involved in cell wall biosynthesis
MSGDIKFEWIKKDPKVEVDTHILIHHSKKNPSILERCLDSIKDEKTNILLVDSNSTNVGYLRAEAIKESKSKYICFIDDDDYYVKKSNGFNTLIAFLNENEDYVGAYTDYIHSHGNIKYKVKKSEWNYIKHLTNPFEVLHLHIFRIEPCLEFLDKLKEWPTLEEAFLLGAIVKYGKWKHFPIASYTKSVTENGAGSKITQDMIHKMTFEIHKYFLMNNKIIRN